MKRFRDAFDQIPQQGGVPQYQEESTIYSDVGDVEIQLRNVDFALKKWFEIDMPIYIRDKHNQQKQTRVVWASEERWSMMQKNQQVRDANGQLILPLISIRRNNVEPINERTVAVDDMGVSNIRVYVHEYVNPHNGKKEYIPKLNKELNVPIKEVIEVQAPKVVRVSYSVTFWSNFMQDLNTMIQHMIRKFGNKHAIYATEKQYFSAFLDGLSNESNDTSIQQDERILRTSFTINVEAGLVDKESIRRYRTIQGMRFKMQPISTNMPTAFIDHLNSLLENDNIYKLEK